MSLRLGSRITITRLDLQKAEQKEHEERRIQVLAAQCINVSITEAMA